jgi:RimJ/RimL family protein N-acetyltransferase
MLADTCAPRIRDGRWAIIWWHEHPRLSDLALPPIPTLETERLILRPFREADADVFCELMQDPDVVRFIGDRRTPSEEDCWRAVAGWLGHWVMRSYGPWAVEERTSGAFMGRAGVHFPATWPGPELAYAFGKPFWGRGYATEAVRAARDWAFTERDFPELISLIDPLNVASVGVATRVGETHRGETTLREHRVLVYAINRGEWEAVRAGEAAASRS